ncbi:polyribonucleotide nucleotidyltransferase [Thermodesulforhabdus norvegica]|uniref:Polyribonucleotide nucleotidyltransferase n=1 Tax=Thermodesulforhabdus norvegica TaxID=39841 RepID=A0A1I4VL63_9BACT|nr:polyribonucleotide nucleotidyltransferase [Thermodesulforhabdus norvegica]SFN01998.1 polyribonucleotide nucleotidyltransferase [Thermodesulforhabdus norvegica]
MKKSVSVTVGGRELIIEAGHLARQASGAVIVRYGDTVVLVSAVREDRVREGIDFVPLLVDYQEMSYAAGRIPGGFFRREIGRPSEKETLTSRLIDRPIRPLFPKKYNHEIQVIATVLSVDQENEPDVLAITGASAALHISPVPFQGPVAAVRVGRVGGEFIINPSAAQLEQSDMNVVVAGTRDAIVMVEGGALFVPEEDLLEALEVAHREIRPIIEAQEELRRLVGRDKEVWEAPPIDEALVNAVRERARDRLREAVTIADKVARKNRKKEILEELVAELSEQFPGQEAEIAEVFGDLEREVVRKMMLTERRRIDGRRFDEIRPIDISVGFLPRTHGSALFRRGETQVLAVTTLGSSADEQKIEALTGETFKSFMLHYNFPPYCVGEVKPLRGPSRREIGHGALAERAVKPILPDCETFPYTIRVVSEVLESNGSSSMATVCGATLSLMDAGVPVKDMVAGIAMGLVKEGDEVIVLTDIIGDEDHLGDMDFKVTGNEKGVTALQMDIKITGISREIMRKALQQARDARLIILEKMRSVLSSPRPALSPYAPRIKVICIPPEKIRDVIGPGGKVIKQIIAETNTKIDIEENGRVIIMGSTEEACEKAAEKIKEVTMEPELGQIYLARITRVTDFGAFAEIRPNLEGLIHISQLDNKRVKKVSDVVKEGDEVLVKVIEIDKDGRVKLSRKAVLEKTQPARK